MAELKMSAQRVRSVLHLAGHPASKSSRSTGGCTMWSRGYRVFQNSPEEIVVQYKGGMLGGKDTHRDIALDGYAVALRGAGYVVEEDRGLIHALRITRPAPARTEVRHG